MIQIKWSQFFAGAFTLLVAAIAGTYTVTVFAGNAEVSAYRLEIDSLKRDVSELKKRLEVCTRSMQRDATGELVSGIDDVTVTLISPVAGATVGTYSRVKFAIQGEVPEGYQVLLAIRDPLGQWWSWGSTGSQQYQRVQFGSAEDSGERFEVRIMIAEQPFARSGVLTDLPLAIASDSAIVFRE